MRSGPLGQHNVAARRPQRLRPPGRVLEEERLLRARGQVRARERARQRRGWPVATAGRGAQDRAVDVRVAQADRERELAAGRDAEHRGARGRQRDAEPRPSPPAHVGYEELLVGREPVRVETGRVLVQPLHLIVEAVRADDQRRRPGRRFERRAPPPGQLAVAREHDRLRHGRRYVRGDLAPAVVAEGLGDELSRDRGHDRRLPCHRRRLRPSSKVVLVRSTDGKGAESDRIR